MSFRLSVLVRLSICFVRSCFRNISSVHRSTDGTKVNVKMNTLFEIHVPLFMLEFLKLGLFGEGKIILLLLRSHVILSPNHEVARSFLSWRQGGNFPLCQISLL